MFGKKYLKISQNISLELIRSKTKGKFRILAELPFPPERNFDSHFPQSHPSCSVPNGSFAGEHLLQEEFITGEAFAPYFSDFQSH